MASAFPPFVPLLCTVVFILLARVYPRVVAQSACPPDRFGRECVESAQQCGVRVCGGGSGVCEHAPPRAAPVCTCVPEAYGSFCNETRTQCSVRHCAFPRTDQVCSPTVRGVVACVSRIAPPEPQEHEHDGSSRGFPLFGIVMLVLVAFVACVLAGGYAHHRRSLRDDVEHETPASELS